MLSVTDRFTNQAALVALTAIVASGIAQCGEHPPRNASTELRRILDWFPEDTETLVAAQSFSISQPSHSETFPGPAKAWLLSLALGELEEFDSGVYLEPLIDRKVLIALNGMRRPKPVGSLGDFHAQGCVVVVFDGDLGQAGVEWTGFVRKNAEEIKKNAGREVFRFRSTKVKNCGLSVYFVRLAPDTILCATHDEFLRQLLNRIDTPPRARAFPENLPHWTAIDRSATVWMIRRVPDSQHRLIDGVTWSWANDQAGVVYLPRGKSAAKVLDQARGRWEASSGNDPGAAPMSETLRRVIRCELVKDGRVLVSFKTDNQDDTVRFWELWNLFTLQHENGNVGAQ